MRYGFSVRIRRLRGAGPLRLFGGLGTLGSHGAATTRRYPGRWIHVGPDGPQVLGFEVTGKSLIWDPGCVALVLMKDGRRKPVVLLPQATTRPGRIEPRQSVRIGLDIGQDEVSEIEEVEVQCGKVTLHIFLQ